MDPLRRLAQQRLRLRKADPQHSLRADESPVGFPAGGTKNPQRLTKVLRCFTISSLTHEKVAKEVVKASHTSVVGTSCAKAPTQSPAIRLCSIGSIFAAEHHFVHGSGSAAAPTMRFYSRPRIRKGMHHLSVLVQELHSRSIGGVYQDSNSLPARRVLDVQP